MAEMVTRASTAALRPIGQGRRQLQRRAARHPAGAAQENGSESNGGTMNFFSLKKVASAAMTCSLAATLTAPAGARRSTPEFRYRSLDRREIENLQRWVAAGHEVWCKDARLVAAEELKRMAKDFAGDAAELNALDAPTPADGAGKATFEWVPLDGRGVYRVTVERFAWLLPIAKDAQRLVWVPTVAEMDLR